MWKPDPIDWLVRSIVGEEPITYYASGVSAPGFACGVNGGLPCAWGANKATCALPDVPQDARNPLVERVSATWFKLGFPLSYWSDVLETVSNLVRLGYAEDPRVKAGLYEPTA